MRASGLKRIRISDYLISITVLLLAVICVLPMLLTFMVSISSEDSIHRNGYSFFPGQVTLDAYVMMARAHSDVSVPHSYLVSIATTAVGTLLALLVTAMAAYALANKNVKMRNGLSLFFYFTMIFSAGIVPWYMMCKNLGMLNNFVSLIVPGLVFNPFNMFLVRTYMHTLPDSLRESAFIDGASDARIAFQIYFPLCLPVLATVALFYGIGYWNNWWNAIMLVNNPRLYPIQYLLLLLKSQISMLNAMSANMGATQTNLPTESLKMATAVVTIGPIIFLYPFLQRYFIKGLTIGAVKG